LACIGTTTKNAAQEMGLQVDVVAQEHTSKGLIQELVRWRKHL
jgi:uroporphyrinogen-III synthase